MPAIMNYKIFDRESFASWQKEKERQIISVSPFLENIAGSTDFEASFSMKTEPAVFVLFWDND